MVSLAWVKEGSSAAAAAAAEKDGSTDNGPGAYSDCPEKTSWLNSEVRLLDCEACERGSRLW